MTITKSEWARPVIDFVDPRELPFIELRSRGELPHLYKNGGSYFVTFRLWDAVEPNCGAGVSPALENGQAGETPVPQLTCKQKWAAIRNEFNSQRSWVNFKLAERLAEIPEPPLNSGSCLLRLDDVGGVVENALLYFHDQRYQLVAWCVMPNHVHVAYTAIGDHSPEDIHHSWKSYTSHQINRALHRTGTLWERESFDHLIRSVEHYEFYIDYIEQNPVAARLCKRPQDWKFSSANRMG